ncbi:MAG: class I SAM-dependent methyltransferase [Ignavibacteriaceae bacterium]|jgi:2-polyprenyl-3-methyl-5-hydroxy-6-metoxy-1,4-benzoquinol methylase
MEVAEKQIPWLDEKHPNYERWKRAREISIERGKFVRSIISKVCECQNLKILDVGSGEGGTSNVLSEDNIITSFDINKIRLQSQKDSISSFNLLCGSSSSLPFKNNSLDLIILQDVLEHLDNREKLIDNIYNLLDDNGMIYLSTPNKFSVINIIADPHWGVPLVSLFKRDNVRKYFLNYFRKSEMNRADIAELLSLKNIYELFADKFEVRLFTIHSVNELFKGNKGIVWSDFHVKLLQTLNKVKLDKVITKLANNRMGFINRFFTPTFYMMFIKKRGKS